MRTQKNQIALAELEFSYQALKRPVNVNLAQNSTQFLKQLRGKPSSGKACDWYVLFVNQSHEVFCWYKLKRQAKPINCIQQLAGLAVACNAYGVLVLNYCDVKSIKVNPLDELFVNTCFNTCAKLNIEIIDYVICNAQTHYSFRDGYRD